MCWKQIFDGGGITVLDVLSYSFWFVVNLLPVRYCAIDSCSLWCVQCNVCSQWTELGSTLLSVLALYCRVTKSAFLLHTGVTCADLLVCVCRAWPKVKMKRKCWRCVNPRVELAMSLYHRWSIATCLCVEMYFLWLVASKSRHGLYTLVLHRYLRYHSRSILAL